MDGQIYAKCGFNNRLYSYYLLACEASVLVRRVVNVNVNEYRWL